jgi:hypothetical protein
MAAIPHDAWKDVNGPLPRQRTRSEEIALACVERLVADEVVELEPERDGGPTPHEALEQTKRAPDGAQQHLTSMRCAFQVAKGPRLLAHLPNAVRVTYRRAARVTHPRKGSG